MVDDAIAAKGWLVLLFHGVGTEATCNGSLVYAPDKCMINYLTTSTEAHAALVQYLAEKKAKFGLRRSAPSPSKSRTAASSRSSGDQLTGTTAAPQSPQKRVSFVYCVPHTGQMVRVMNSVCSRAGGNAGAGTSSSPCSGHVVVPGLKPASAHRAHRAAGAGAERGLRDQAIAVVGAELRFGRELFTAVGQALAPRAPGVDARGRDGASRLGSSVGRRRAPDQQHAQDAEHQRARARDADEPARLVGRFVARHDLARAHRLGRDAQHGGFLRLAAFVQPASLEQRVVTFLRGDLDLDAHRAVAQRHFERRFGLGRAGGWR